MEQHQPTNELPQQDSKLSQSIIWEYMPEPTNIDSLKHHFADEEVDDVDLNSIVDVSATDIPSTISSPSNAMEKPGLLQSLMQSIWRKSEETHVFSPPNFIPPSPVDFSDDQKQQIDGNYIRMLQALQTPDSKIEILIKHVPYKQKIIELDNFESSKKNDEALLYKVDDFLTTEFSKCTPQQILDLNVLLKTRNTILLEHFLAKQGLKKVMNLLDTTNVLQVHLDDKDALLQLEIIKLVKDAICSTLFGLSSVISSGHYLIKSVAILINSKHIGLKTNAIDLLAILCNSNQCFDLIYSSLQHADFVVKRFLQQEDIELPIFVQELQKELQKENWNQNYVRAAVMLCNALLCNCNSLVTKRLLVSHFLKLNLFFPSAQELDTQLQQQLQLFSSLLQKEQQEHEILLHSVKEDHATITDPIKLVSLILEYLSHVQQGHFVNMLQYLFIASQQSNTNWNYLEQLIQHSLLQESSLEMVLQNRLETQIQLNKDLEKREEVFRSLIQQLLLKWTLKLQNNSDSSIVVVNPSETELHEEETLLPLEDEQLLLQLQTLIKEVSVKKLTKSAKLDHEMQALETTMTNLKQSMSPYPMEFKQVPQQETKSHQETPLVAPPPPPLPGTSKVELQLPLLPLYTPNVPVKPFFWTAIPKHEVVHTIFIKQGIATASKIVNFDMDSMEHYFSTVPLHTTLSIPIQPEKKKKVSLMDSKRSYGISIVLKTIKLSTMQLCEGILQRNSELITKQVLESLVKILPTNEEILLLKQYKGNIDELAEVEAYFVHCLQISNFVERIVAWEFIENQYPKLSQVLCDIQSISFSSQQILTSKSLHQLLSIVLAMGNFLNASKKKVVHGFKLETLNKLKDAKSTDQRMNLLQYLVQVVKNKYPQVMNIVEELSNIPPSTRIDLHVVREEIKALEKGIKFVTQTVLHLSNREQVWISYLQHFLKQAKEKMGEIQEHVAAMEEKLQQLANLFAEDAQILLQNPASFFQILSQFLSSLQEAELNHLRKESILSKQV